MVCPYCGTRNSTNAPVCVQCGAILRDSFNIKAKSQRKSYHIVTPKIKLASLLVMLTAPLVAFAIGFLLGGVAYEHDRRYQALFGLGAAVISVVAILVVSFGRITFLRFIYTSNRNKLRRQVDLLIAKAEKELEDSLKEQNNGETRYQLGSVYLLGNDLEKSVHQFEQAQMLNTPAKPQDLNNLAIVLASRGQISAAYERLERAASVSPLSPQPKFNLARILNQTGREVDAQAAEQRLIESEKLLNENVDLLNQLGLAFIVEGKHDDAVRTFEHSANLSSKAKDREALINSRNNIAMAHAVADRRSDAQTELVSILKAEPENARAVANLGVLQIGLGKYNDAIDRLMRALQIDPNLALAHCNLGYAYSVVGQINEGIREFRSAVLLEPHVFEAQYNLGKAYLDEGILDVAETSLIRALQLRRTAWQVHQSLGILYYRRGLYDKAIASFTDSLKLSPNEPVTLSALGVTYVKRGLTELAYKQFELALKTDNQNAEVLTNLSWIEVMDDLLNDATDTSKKALAADQADAQAHNNLGLCQLALGAPEIALDEFKKALAIDASLTKIHHQLACAHIGMKQIDNAIKEWREASQAEPGNGDVYSNLGVALYRQGRAEDAIAEFRRVLRVRTDRKEDYINLGLALASAKHHKEAIEQFDKALSMDPRNAVVHSNRGLACYFANNVEEAMREWTLVTQLDPAYAKRRGKKQESEYDDAIIEYTGLNTNQRAMYIEPHTASYLYRYLPGYATDKWLVISPRPDLDPVSGLQSQIARLDRQLRGLDFG